MYFLRRYDWLLHIATIVLCAFFFARGLSFYFSSLLETAAVVVIGARRRPASATVSDDKDKKGADDYQVIVERNIFNSKDLPAPEISPSVPTAQQLGELGPAVKTALDVKIGSTLKIGDGTDRRSSAIVAVGRSKGQTYFVGDEEGFAPSVKLMKVRRRRVEFLNGGRLEYAEMEDISKTIFAPAEEVFGKLSLGKDSKIKPKSDSAGSSGGTIFVDQKDVDNALQHLDTLQREVNIVPNFQNGKLDGFRIVAIRPGGLVSKLGVRRGDVLQKVNGQDLDIKQGLQLFNSLKDSKNFSLEVLRGGQPQTLEYEIR
ncbi:MAG TPA: type II secretion system protein GspC [bacterium]|nr:type II secretion system protein GspC [bacterium]